METDGASNSRDDLLDSDDVARILKRSKRTVRELWQTGQLGGFRLGHRGVRFSREDVDRYLEARRVLPHD